MTTGGGQQENAITVCSASMVMYDILSITYLNIYVSYYFSANIGGLQADYTTTTLYKREGLMTTSIAGLLFIKVWSICIKERKTCKKKLLQCICILS